MGRNGAEGESYTGKPSANAAVIPSDRQISIAVLIAGGGGEQIAVRKAGTQQRDESKGRVARAGERAAFSPFR